MKLIRLTVTVICLFILSMNAYAITWYNLPAAETNIQYVGPEETNQIQRVPVGCKSTMRLIATDLDYYDDPPLSVATPAYSLLRATSNDGYASPDNNPSVLGGNNRDCYITVEKTVNTPKQETPHDVVFTIDDIGQYNDTPISCTVNVLERIWFGPGDIMGSNTICRNSTTQFCAVGLPAEYSESCANKLHWYISPDATPAPDMSNMTEISAGNISIDKSNTSACKSMVTLPCINPGHYWLWVRAEERGNQNQINVATEWEHAKSKEIVVLEAPNDLPDCGTGSSCAKGCEHCYSVDPKDGYLSEWPVITSTAGSHSAMLPLSVNSTAGGIVNEKNVYTSGKHQIVAFSDGACNVHYHLHVYLGNGKVMCANSESGAVTTVPQLGIVTRYTDHYTIQYLDGSVEDFYEGTHSNVAGMKIYDYVKSSQNSDGVVSTSWFNNGVYTYKDAPVGGKSVWMHQYEVSDGKLNKYTLKLCTNIDDNSDGSLYTDVKTCNYTYNALNRLTGVNIVQPDELDQNITVSYDASGDIQSINQNGKITFYERDSNNGVSTLTVTTRDSSNTIYAATDYAFGDTYTTISQRDVTNSSNTQTVSMDYIVDTNGYKRYVYNIMEPSGIGSGTRTTTCSLYVAGGFTWGSSTLPHVVTTNNLMWGNVITELSGDRSKSYQYDTTVGLPSSITFPSVKRGQISDAGVVSELDYIPTELYQYDSQGHVTQYNRLDNTISQYTYDNKNRVTGVTDAKGTYLETLTVAYDSTTGVVTSKIWNKTIGGILSPVIQQTNNYYTTGCSAGKLQSVIITDRINNRDLSNSSRSYTYNGLLQPGVTLTTDQYYKDGNAWRTCSTASYYDSIGNIYKTTDANGHDIEYSKVKGTNTKTERTIYNAQSFTEKVSDCCKVLYEKDIDGKTKYYSYDPIGRVCKIHTDEMGQSEDTPLLQYTYDGFGRVSSVISRSNSSTPRTTTYTYDTQNRVTVIDNPGWLYDENTYYDVYGNVMARSKGSGQTNMYKYDALNRLTDEYYLWDRPNPLVLPTTASDMHKLYEYGTNKYVAENAYKYKYNDQGKLSSVYWFLTGKTTTYTYDTYGRKSSYTHDNNTTSYTYDPMGNLETVSLNNALVSKYTYDNIGNRTRAEYGGMTPTSWENYTYNSTDARNFITGIDYAYKCDTNETLSYKGGIRLTYNNGGNPLSWADNSDKFIKTYSYDTQGRLANADIPGVNRTNYSYDWVGNRTLPTAVYNTADQLTSFNGNNYVYLGDGGMYTGAGRTFGYYPNGDPYQVSLNGTSKNGRFSPHGLREVSYGAATTKYSYDITASIPAMISEGPNDGTTTYFYVREPDGTLILRKSGTDYKYYHFDEHGNTLFLTDANGVLTDKYVYDSWGKVVSSSGSTVNPYRYVGRYGYYYDTETNLYLLGKRYYDADAGVFCQRDEAKDGLSYYSYTSGIPMTAIDPWGEKSWDDGPSYRFGRLLGLTALDSWGLYTRTNSVAAYIHNCIKMLYTDGYDAAQNCLDIAAEAVEGLPANMQAIATAKAYLGGEKGFESYRDFKAFFGSAGKGLEWHHIVEQCAIRAGSAIAQQVNNIKNMVKLTKQQHGRISGYYSRKIGDNVFRESTRRMEFGAQHELGIEILKELCLPFML